MKLNTTGLCTFLIQKLSSQGNRANLKSSRASLSFYFFKNHSHLEDKLKDKCNFGINWRKRKIKPNKDSRNSSTISKTITIYSKTLSKMCLVILKTTRFIKRQKNQMKVKVLHTMIQINSYLNSSKIKASPKILGLAWSKTLPNLI